MSEIANEEKGYPSNPKKINQQILYSGAAFSSIGESFFYTSQPLEAAKLFLTICYGSGSIHRTRHDFLSIQHPVLSSHLMYQKDREIVLLQKRIGEMKNRIESLEEKIGFAPVQVRVVTINDKTQDEVNNLVLDYYKSHGKAYPSDIANELGLSLEAVFNAVDKLEGEEVLETKEEDEYDNL
jgi:hypothetical protein